MRLRGDDELILKQENSDELSTNVMFPDADCGSARYLNNCERMAAMKARTPISLRRPSIILASLPTT